MLNVLNHDFRILALSLSQVLVIHSGRLAHSPQKFYRKAAFLAGVTSTAAVVQKLAAAFADDGVLDQAEIDSAFNAPKSDITN